MAALESMRSAKVGRVHLSGSCGRGIEIELAGVNRWVLQTWNPAACACPCSISLAHPLVRVGHDFISGFVGANTCPQEQFPPGTSALFQTILCSRPVALTPDQVPLGAHVLRRGAYPAGA